jgi:hypothetical protein
MECASFKSFTQRIAKLPAQAIISAIDRECDMLRRDLAEQNGLSEQAYSILYFKIFVRAAKNGEILDLTIQLPADEVDFFQRTTNRLVQAEALPLSALDHFETTFRVTDKARNIQTR